MDAQRKRTNQSIKELRSALAVGDKERFKITLEAKASTALLKAIREQKLLIKPHTAGHEPIIEILMNSASEVLSQKELKEYLAYLAFIRPWQQSKQLSESRFVGCFTNFPKVSTEQLLEIFDSVLERYFLKMPSSSPQQHETVAEFERKLHHQNGTLNDVYFAAVRALNDASRHVVAPKASKLSPSRRLSATRHFYKAVQFAAEANSLDWIMDAVSYGDFSVVGLESGSPTSVRLEYTDVRRSLLRELAIRRRLIIVINNARKQRFVREMLKASEIATINEAIDYYTELVGLDPARVETEQLFGRSANALAQIDAEDDLLAVASSLAGEQNWATFYLTSICLTWFGMAAGAVRESLPRSRRRRLTTPIPKNSVEFAVLSAGGERVFDTMSLLSNTLPAKSHYDLLRRPILRVTDCDTLWLLQGDSGLWNLAVREALLSGGKVGDAYGHVWEEFLAWSFKDSDWQLIGRNKRLRLAGQTTTEVDLLLKKNDLLLVIEVKALIGSSINSYDHWRSRQTVEWGCRQAAAAAAFIKSNKNWLVSVAGKQLAEEVCHIQPLVLTNNDILDGWHFEGVPVMGEVGRKAITEGAKVDYTDQSGHIFSTHWITKKEDLTTDRILWSLKNPVELSIAPESLETSHRILKLRDLTVLIPEFDLRDDLENVPAIAASS